MEMSLQVSKTPPSEQSRLWRTRAFSSESGVTSWSSRCFMWGCVVLTLWCEASGFLVSLLRGERNSLNSTTVVATGLSLWSRPGCALLATRRKPPVPTLLSASESRAVTLAHLASQLHGFDQNRSATQKRKLILQRCPLCLFSQPRPSPT